MHLAGHWATGHAGCLKDPYVGKCRKLKKEKLHVKDDSRTCEMKGGRALQHSPTTRMTSVNACSAHKVQCSHISAWGTSGAKVHRTLVFLFKTKGEKMLRLRAGSTKCLTFIPSFDGLVQREPVRKG